MMVNVLRLNTRDLNEMEVQFLMSFSDMQQLTVRHNYCDLCCCTSLAHRSAINNLIESILNRYT